jgi:hypothetical protein
MRFDLAGWNLNTWFQTILNEHSHNLTIFNECQSVWDVNERFSHVVLTFHWPFESEFKEATETTDCNENYVWLDGTGITGRSKSS